MKIKKLMLSVVVLFVAQVFFVSAITELSPKECPEVGASYTDERGYYYECRGRGDPILELGSAWYYKSPGSEEFKKSGYQDGVTKIWKKYGNQIGINLEIKDISEIMGIKDKEIIGKGIEYEIRGKNIRLTFLNHVSAILDVDGDMFINIVPQEIADHPTYIDLDKEGEIIKADFTVNDPGESYMFGSNPVNATPASKVFFDKDTGVNIEFPDGADLSDYSDLYLSNEHITKIRGNDIKLPEGVVMSGELIIKDGQVFIGKEDTVEINNVKIINSYVDTPVFFDGKRHDGGISFGEENLIVSSPLKRASPVIVFNEGNPYIKIDEGDYVALQTDVDSEIEIKNRDSLGLIPRVTSRGFFKINEDRKSIFNAGKKVYFSSSVHFLEPYEESKDSATSPIEFFMLDKKGTSLFGDFNTEEGHKIFVDNFNRIAIVPKDAEEFLDQDEGIDIKFSSRLRYNYVTEEYMEKLTGTNIDFLEGMSKGSREAVLGRIRDYWKTLTPETKESIDFIDFRDDAFFYEKGMGSSWAFAADYGGAVKGIVFKEGYLDLEAFKHEYAHIRYYSMERQYADPIVEKRIEKIGQEHKKRLKKWAELFHSLKTSTEDEKKVIKAEMDRLERERSKLAEEMEKEQEKTTVMSAFKSEWYAVAGDVYRKNILDILWLFGPLKGIVKPYGNTNHKEDVATFVAEVGESPCFFRDHGLMNPMDLRYDSRYKAKLDLLYKYKFISYKEYNGVLECAGVT